MPPSPDPATARRLVWTLHASTFAFFFSFALVIPVLPTYLADGYGVGTAWLGWAIGLMPLAGILLRPWSGWLSDGWSRRLPTLAGLVLSGLAGLLYLGWGGLPLVLLARVLQGLGIALYAPASLAVTSDLTPDERLTGVMSTRNLLVGVGLMAGTGAGGLLADLAGTRAVFLVMAALPLAAAAALLPLPETLVERSRAAWWAGYLRSARIRAILAATLGNLGFAAVFGALQAFYPLVLDRAGYAVALVGAFFGFYGLVSVLFRLPAGPLARRFGADRVALWGFGLGLAGLLALWAMPLPPAAFLAGALLGAGSGLYLPANLVAVSRAAPAAVRGSAFSLYTVSWDLGGVLGPVLGGWVVAASGLELAVLPFTAAVAAGVIVVYVGVAGARVLRPRPAGD